METHVSPSITLRYLLVRSPGMLSEEWKRRWCVLSGCYLVFFEDDSEQKYVSSIDFEHMEPSARERRFVVRPAKSNYALTKQLAGTYGKLYIVEILLKEGSIVALQASDQCDLEEWLNALYNQVQHFFDTPYSCRWEVSPAIKFKLQVEKFIMPDVSASADELADDMESIRVKLREKGYILNEKEVLGAGKETT